MTDRRVAVLERAALHYADIRDERMAWTKKEVEAKKRVQTLMHQEHRDHYVHANVEIILEPEGEKVTVRIRDRKQEPEPVDEPVEQPPAPVEEPETPETEPVQQHGPENEEEEEEEEEIPL